MKTRLIVDVQYDPAVTDPEGLAAAADRLMSTICSTPGILDDYANPVFGDFFPVKAEQDRQKLLDQTPATNVTRRYVLYDFDMGNMATTRVYDDYQEAVDDASELNNVMVLALDFESCYEVGEDEGCNDQKTDEAAPEPRKTTIGTGVHGITVSLDGYGSGIIRSDLHESEEYPEATAAIDALESLILAHACADVDITDPAYLEGIETAVDAIANQDWDERERGSTAKSYSLNIDGPQFRAQRLLLLKLRARIERLVPPTSSPDEKELLKGLINLTDALADQAHDVYGIDCLIDQGDQPCECELPGRFFCGVPGILAHLENGRLAPGAEVQRCDLCQRYPSDTAARQRLRELGIAE